MKETKQDVVKRLQESLNAQQQSVPQLPATARAKKIKALGSKTDPKHPFSSYMVGADESVEESDAALQFATKAHAGQTRSGGDPYITHPMRVAASVEQFKKSHNLDAMIDAALLHDTVEDTDTTYEDLEALFGGLVASLVKELTSDPDEIKRVGKAAYLANKMETMSSYALVIKLADRLDNVKDIATTRTPQWRHKYRAETEHILDHIEKNRELTGTHRKIIQLIKEKLGELDNQQEVAETAAWKRKEGKSKSGGLNAKGVASYRRENPGSKLQTAVTTKPSKLKAGSKDAKRRKSFCARMSGVKGPMKKPNGDPTRKALALRKWNCNESIDEATEKLGLTNKTCNRCGGKLVRTATHLVCPDCKIKWAAGDVNKDVREEQESPEDRQVRIAKYNAEKEAERKAYLENKLKEIDVRIKKIKDGGMTARTIYNMRRIMEIDRLENDRKKVVELLKYSFKPGVAEMATPAAIKAKNKAASQRAGVRDDVANEGNITKTATGLVHHGKYGKEKIGYDDYNHGEHVNSLNKIQVRDLERGMDVHWPINKGGRPKDDKIAEAVANEDVLSALKNKLGDLLLQTLGREANDSDLRDKPSAQDDKEVCPIIKKITTDDGREICIHGNEDDGFHISVKGKEGSTKFESLEHAEIASKMYCARRRNRPVNTDYIDEA